MWTEKFQYSKGRGGGGVLRSSNPKSELNLKPPPLRPTPPTPVRGIRMILGKTFGLPVTSFFITDSLSYTTCEDL